MAYDTPFHTANTAPATATAASATAAATTSTSTSAPAAVAAGAKPVAKPSTAAAGSITAAAAPTAAVSAASIPTPGSAAATAAAATGPTPVTSVPLRRQLAHGFKDMGTRSYSTAKNFGAVGALFSGIECGIEGLRAKNDLANGVAAGCLTGAILARNAGPQAAAVGCAGFAAFSAAIDTWLRMPKDE